MSRIIRVAVRSSGRDVTVVRRPQRMAPGRPIPAVSPASEASDATVEAPDFGSMLKADVVALAESRGIDASGTKADIVARLSDG